MLVQGLSAKLGVATGRNLAEVCRDELPRRVTHRALAPGRGDRDGDGSRGVPRRRDRTASPVRDAAAARGVRHRDRFVPHPRPAAVRLPAARGDDRRDRARDRRLLRDRAVLRAALARADGEARGRPRLRRQQRGHPALGRDHRRDGDAARDLAPLGADAGPRPPRERQTAAAADALHVDRRADRDDDRRADQRGDARDGRGHLLQERPPPRRVARGRAQDARAAARQRGERDLRAGAARVGAVELRGRDALRPGGDAGLPPPPDPARRAQARDDAARVHRDRDRSRARRGRSCSAR